MAPFSIGCITFQYDGEFVGLLVQEAANLYTHPATIGFKLNWDRLLQEKGLSICGYELQQLPNLGMPEMINIPRLATGGAMNIHDGLRSLEQLLEFLKH